MKSITIRLRKEHVMKLFPHLKNVETKDFNNGELAMFKSGAKLYKSSRPGDWRISGYAQDGHDVIAAIQELFI